MAESRLLQNDCAVLVFVLKIIMKRSVILTFKLKDGNIKEYNTKLDDKGNRPL